MSRKKTFTILSIALLLFAIGAVAWRRGGGLWGEEHPLQSRPPDWSAPLLSPLPKAAAPQRPGPGNVHVLPEGEEIARQLNAKDATAKEDLEIVDLLITIFRKTNNGLNPEGGLNDEIAGALAGKNGKLLAVLPPDHPAFSKTGELLDRWGTPYYFHPVTSREIDLRSAGPDGALWTADDVMQ